MSQLNLFGDTKEQEAEKQREKYQMEFFKEELSELKKIKEVVENGNGIIILDEDCNCEIEFKEGNPSFLGKEDDWHFLWLKKKFLGEWWYCNAIKGWNNNTPQEKNLYEANDYDEVPKCDLMSESIRSCFVSVDRDEISWDKDYCLDRLSTAIECYEKEIKGESSEIMVEEKVKNVKTQKRLIEVEGGND